MWWVVGKQPTLAVLRQTSATVQPCYVTSTRKRKLKPTELSRYLLGTTVRALTVEVVPELRGSIQVLLPASSTLHSALPRAFASGTAVLNLWVAVPLGGQTTLSQGSPKTIPHSRNLHYDS